MMSDGTQNIAAFHAVVRGRVQRVGFRVYTRDSAREHQVNGWVRNLGDGTVEVYGEGDEMALTEFLTDLHRGPVLSHVTDIDIEWKEVAPSFDSFSILR